MIFLEDDDVAAVVDGRLSIHRVKRTAGDHPGRAVQTLQMELQQIMKGERGWGAPGGARGEGLESPSAVPAPGGDRPCSVRSAASPRTEVPQPGPLPGKQVLTSNGTFPLVVGTLLRRIVGLRILLPAWSHLLFPRLIPDKLASLDLPFTDTFQKLE